MRAGGASRNASRSSAAAALLEQRPDRDAHGIEVEDRALVAVEGEELDAAGGDAGTPAEPFRRGTAGRGERLFTPT